MMLILLVAIPDETPIIINQIVVKIQIIFLLSVFCEIIAGMDIVKCTDITTDTANQACEETKSRDSKIRHVHECLQISASIPNDSP